MERFQEGGLPVNCVAEFDTSNVRGKTAVVTGGSNGIGEAYVCALASAGAFVVFGDVDEESGKRVASSVGNDKAHFVKCDVTKWSDQLAMFKHALALSPHGRIDIVIPNAGIGGSDDVFMTNAEVEEPEEPLLDIVKINGIGVLYTTKLALHYFRRQFKLNPEASEDQLLIMQGSLAGYMDMRSALQYPYCKYGMRAIMRNLRLTEHKSGIRVNYVAPWFIATKILRKQDYEKLVAAGIEFAEIEHAARAVMRFASDPSINGRSLTAVPVSVAESGYIDLEEDEPKKGSLCWKWQQQSSKDHALEGNLIITDLWSCPDRAAITD